MCSADGRTTQRLQGRVLFFPTAVSMVVETEMIEREGLCALSGTKWGRGPTLRVTKQHCSNRPLRFGSRGDEGGLTPRTQAVECDGSGLKFECWLVGVEGRHATSVTGSMSPPVPVSPKAPVVYTTGPVILTSTTPHPPELWLELSPPPPRPRNRTGSIPPPHPLGSPKLWLELFPPRSLELRLEFPPPPPP